MVNAPVFGVDVGVWAGVRQSVAVVMLWQCAAGVQALRAAGSARQMPLTFTQALRFRGESNFT